MPAAGFALLTPADSARAVSTVYTASLLAMLPTLLAAFAAVSLRRSTAESRMLVWRSAVVTLLVVYVGRQLPLHWLSWAIPSSLAAPLIALGRVRVTSAALPMIDAAGTSWATSMFVQLLLLVYVGGAMAVLVPTMVGSMSVQRMIRRARPVREALWSATLAEVRHHLGVRRSVRLFFSDETLGPVTWGVIRPVVVLPASANGCRRSCRVRSSCRRSLPS